MTVTVKGLHPLHYDVIFLARFVVILNANNISNTVPQIDLECLIIRFIAAEMLKFRNTLIYTAKY